MGPDHRTRCTADSKSGFRVRLSRLLYQLRHRSSVKDDLRCQDGQAMVEFAITFSVLVTFFFAFIQICLIFYSYSMIAESAREGSRYAILHGATCVTPAQVSCTASVSGINSYISANGWANLGGGTMTPSTSFPDGNQNPGSRVLVKVQYAFPVNVPFLPSNSISMASTSEMYIVQ